MYILTTGYTPVEARLVYACLHYQGDLSLNVNTDTFLFSPVRVP